MTEIGIKRKKHEIRVAGKLFEFYLIPVIVEELLIKHDEAFSEFGEKIKASEDFDSMGTIINERNKACGGILFDALQALVEANGIEFDAGWWKASIDYQGILEIISTMKVVEYADKIDKKKVSQ